MKFIYILIVAFTLATPACYAENYSQICRELENKLNILDANSNVQKKVTIVKDGMLKFYGSPDIHCKNRGRRVKKGEVFTVLGTYENWKKMKYEDEIEVGVTWVLKSDFDEMFNNGKP